MTSVQLTYGSFGYAVDCRLDFSNGERLLFWLTDRPGIQLMTPCCGASADITLACVPCDQRDPAYAMVNEVVATSSDRRSEKQLSRLNRWLAWRLPPLEAALLGHYFLDELESKQVGPLADFYAQANPKTISEEEIIHGELAALVAPWGAEWSL